MILIALQSPMELSLLLLPVLSNLLVITLFARIIGYDCENLGEIVWLRQVVGRLVVSIGVALVFVTL
jgi:hypothetical protein